MTSEEMFELHCLRAEVENLRSILNTRGDILDERQDEITRLRAELIQCRKEKNQLVLQAYPAMDERDTLRAENAKLLRILAEALETDGGSNDTGFRPCCCVPTDKPHMGDCWVAEGRALTPEKTDGK